MHPKYIERLQLKWRVTWVLTGQEWVYLPIFCSSVFYKNKRLKVEAIYLEGCHMLFQ